jgi:hypothetical protein
VKGISGRTGALAFWNQAKRAAQSVPPVVGARDRHRPLRAAGRRVGRGGLTLRTPRRRATGAHLELDAVDHERRVPAEKTQLDPGLLPVEVHGADRVVVHEELALDLRGDAPRARDGLQPPGRRRVDDTVGDELRGQVVVVGARLVRRPAPGEVAVGRRVGHERGGEVLAGVAGVDADPARLDLRGRRARREDHEQGHGERPAALHRRESAVSPRPGGRRSPPSRNRPRRA